MKGENIKPLDEKSGLNEIAKTFKQDEGFNKVLSERYSLKKILELCKGGSILELGCGEGLITHRLVDHFEKIVAVDGSDVCIEKAKRKIDKTKMEKVTFIVSLFEEFETDEKFDNIVLSHVLEHVVDPVYILKKAKNWIKKGGSIIIIVPNASSLHRRIGMNMGLIKSLDELGEHDRIAGHRRYYNIKKLKEDVFKAGLKIDDVSGILLKPLPNNQMMNLSLEVTDAFFEIGKELPEYCAEICIKSVVS
jgi:2-polyprenyl-3-methyl-5-hydroxy-6-metoxy-1,4-benzoquinol methylase